MSGTPEISVVIGAYNGMARLERTLASVLSQDVDLEIVCVDDGSDDGTGALLAELATGEPRLRVLLRAHDGLTAALVAGCAAARGELIARQDVGDSSLPQRLAKQRDAFARAETVLVSCGTRFLGPGDEPLFEVRRTGEQMARSYRDLDIDHLHGVTHHGSTMFRRKSYEAVGGYRPAFRVAQDLDLWLRLSEAGRIAGVDEVLYEARIDAGSISGSRRTDQIRAARVALLAARRRRAGHGDADLLDASSLDLREPGPWVRAWRRAQSQYFIGSCLSARQPTAARQYFRGAIRAFPLHVRSWVALGALGFAR